MKKFNIDDLEKKTPFIVPEGYFSNLKVDIQDRVTESPKREWIPARQLKWALAGTFVLLTAAILIFRPTTAELSPEDILAQVSEEDLLEYLDLSEVSEFELLEDLSSSEIDELWEEDQMDDLLIEDDLLDDLLLEYEQI